MPDAHLNYRIEGSGPALLMVHGFGISFNIWAYLLPLLSSHFTLLLVELPGIGSSPAPEAGRSYLEAAADGIEYVRRAAGIERWDVLGYSSGSRAAEAYVQKYPQSVGSAVFLCPAYARSIKTSALRVSLWLDQVYPRWGDWVLRDWRLKFVISLFGFNLKRDAHADEWYAEISRLPVSVLKETIRSLPDFGARPFAVPVPASFIWGDVDIVPDRPKRMNGRDALIHANHAAPVLNPQAVAQAVLEALQE
jgi:pimeloyl-ACP methyl ester carboxylesterase